MPLIKIHTSKAADDGAFTTVMKKLSGALAEITGKPEEVIMVTLSQGPVVMAGEIV
ncbi:MAG: hypothetical protein JXR91_12070 [Deltaproteobacteria bacterium]|nr:hypothetical protein [Deltaproteobacteria bacterium]